MASLTLIGALNEFARLEGARIEATESPASFKYFRNADQDAFCMVQCDVRLCGVAVPPTSLEQPLEDSDEIELHDLFC